MAHNPVLVAPGFRSQRGGNSSRFKVLAPEQSGRYLQKARCNDKVCAVWQRKDECVRAEEMVVRRLKDGGIRAAYNSTTP